MIYNLFSQLTNCTTIRKIEEDAPKIFWLETGFLYVTGAYFDDSSFYCFDFEGFLYQLIKILNCVKGG